MSEDITVYPVEILLLAFYPWLLRTIRFKLQKTLMAMWLLFFVATLISQLYEISAGSILRCVKGMAYVPLFFIASRTCWVDLKKMSLVFIVAAVLNLVWLFVNGFSFASLNIWDSSLLSSGFSNKYIDLKSLQIANISRGAHGIWGDYCSLALCASFVAFEHKEVSKVLLAIVFLLASVSIGMTVSRESLIVFGFLMMFYIKVKIGSGTTQERYLYFIVILLFALLFYFAIAKYGDNIALIRKLKYTQESIEDTGSESNILARIGAWRMYFGSIIRRPYMALTGYGYNFHYYSTFLDFRLDSVQKYVALPESFFVQSMLCGGVFAFYYAIRFWRYMYMEIKKIRKIGSHSICLGLFLGLLFANIFSGASITSDLFYGQILIFLGVVHRYNKDTLARTVIH